MKKFFLFFVAKKVVFFAFMFLPFFASAAAYAPVKVSNAVSGVIEQKLINRGFAANDPRYAATIQNTGNVITAAAGAGAAAIVVGALTAPAWVTAAIAAGVAVAVGYAVSLAVDGITQWLFGSDSTQVNVVAADGSSFSSGGPLILGGPFWRSSYGYGSSPENAIYANWAQGVTVSNVKCTISTSNPNMGTCTSTGAADWGTVSDNVMNINYQSSGSPYASSTGAYQIGVGVMPAPSTNTGSGKTGVIAIQAAVDQIPDT